MSLALTGLTHTLIYEKFNGITSKMIKEIHNMNEQDVKCSPTKLSKKLNISTPLLSFHLRKCIKYKLLLRIYNNEGIYNELKLTILGNTIKRILDKRDNTKI